ncbi:hypothetical protein Acr_00g0043460 [Actinidia rufa]|uniref:Uncharacterized protein n=1 Tax=Actinidia rufa TaxID=165716 RepID=A0A7J0DIP6_9ERIC|nr:hypothetical protein Acr_00g0043460 [Actinidia rufa]
MVKFNQTLFIEFGTTTNSTSELNSISITVAEEEAESGSEDAGGLHGRFGLEAGLNVVHAIYEALLLLSEAGVVLEEVVDALSFLLIAFARSPSLGGTDEAIAETWWGLSVGFCYEAYLSSVKRLAGLL